MVKVITYGTYDLLHYGHINLLKRAKELGDYLIVGITADDFDKNRGKINVVQSLMERVEAVRSTGIADEIIIEEYEGQKIDDIRKYNIDVFTVGSDWEGCFDYLKEYCNVVYLERTQGVSSSEIRECNRQISLGIVGNSMYLKKVLEEIKYVNGLKFVGICTDEINEFADCDAGLVTSRYEQLLDACDAVYIHSYPQLHYCQVKKALDNGKHVLCESPSAMSTSEYDELIELAREKKCIFMDALRTAFSTAFARLVLLVKGGKIGRVVSVDAVCTSLQKVVDNDINCDAFWSSITAWGPTALLPVFQLLGFDFNDIRIASSVIDEEKRHDIFTKITFEYPKSVASIKIGTGVKSEGELIISGTKGYIYVPAPWWKTDYFEIRYENQSDNKRYFYQLDGEGIRYEFLSFSKMIANNEAEIPRIDNPTARMFCQIIEMFNNSENTTYI